MEDVITLISVGDREFDSWGIPQESSYTRRQVLCDVRSAGRSEFYQAAQNGLKPELEANLFFLDYEGEPMAMVNDANGNGIYYKVIRTYRAESADTDRIILTLERDIGGKPDREPKILEVDDDELTTNEGQLLVDVDT